MHMIANIRENVPTTYPGWKTHICKMYEERQRQYIIQKMLTSNDSHPDHQPNTKPRPPNTSPSKHAGATSSTLAKTTGGGQNRDMSTGKWVPVKTTMYTRQGQLMEIDRLRKEG